MLIPYVLRLPVPLEIGKDWIFESPTVDLYLAR